MIDLYKNIKRERLARNMSQKELAKHVGYSDKTMISRIENGKIDLPQSKIEEFAKVFDVSPGYLMGWEVPKETIDQLEHDLLDTRLNGFTIDINDGEKVVENERKFWETHEEYEKAKQAMKFFDLYKTADKNVQDAIDSLLGVHKSDS